MSQETRSLIFNSGGRPYNNKDFQAIQEFVDNYNELFENWQIDGQSAFFLTTPAAIGGEGYIYLNGKVRYIPASPGFSDGGNPFYITIDDQDETRIYADGNEKVAFTLHNAAWANSNAGFVAGEYITFTGVAAFNSGKFNFANAAGFINQTAVNGTVPRYTAGKTLSDSIIVDTGSGIHANTKVTIGQNSVNAGTYKLYVVGDIYATGDIWSNSDIELKENVELIDNPIQKIQALKGVSYNWKADQNKDRHIGLIAQDVESVIPECVTNNDGTKAVEYTKLTSVLVEAIKDQQKQIEELQQEIKRLK
jgi:hypothetical protein